MQARSLSMLLHMALSPCIMSVRAKLLCFYAVALHVCQAACAPPSWLTQGVREGSQLLAQAFEQDPENPFVLLLLAHFCLRQGYADKV